MRNAALGSLQPEPRFARVYHLNNGAERTGRPAAVGQAWSRAEGTQHPALQQRPREQNHTAVECKLHSRRAEAWRVQLLCPLLQPGSTAL